MKINKVSILYFSPTGNTKKVCRQIAEGFSGEIEELDRTPFENRWKGREFAEDQLVVIGLPVYYGRLPKLMGEFFREIRGNRTPAILAVTYGNRAYEDGLLELKNEALKYNFLPIAACACVGEHTFTDKMGTGRPDQTDIEQLKTFAGQVKELLDAGEFDRKSLEVKGNFPYCKGNHLPMSPSLTGHCTECNRCTTDCPVQAINPGNVGETDPWRCIQCGLCIKQCPSGARQFAVPGFTEKIRLMEAMMSDPRENEFFIAG